MKKIIIILIACFILTGCTLSASNNKFHLNGYGKYQIPSNAYFRKDHSSSRKLFFVKEQDKNNRRPNNISVEGGTNKYSKENHLNFRNAILTQIYSQASRYGSTVKSNGSNTKNGYVVYSFDIDSKSSHTIQYYIVGNYKYILIHETVLNGSEDKELNEIAKYIINSFEWE